MEAQVSDPFEPRFNLEAEEAVVGICLTQRAGVERSVAELTAGDFYSPKCAKTFAAVVELHHDGRAVDAVTVGDVLHRDGRLEEIGGGSTLIHFQAAGWDLHNLPTYLGIIRRESAARTIQTSIGTARAAIDDNADPAEVADVLSDALRSLDRGGQLPERYWPSTNEYLAVDRSKTVGVPLVPGVVGQHTRILILATEKLGKSMWLRQFAFCAAAGLHPFTFKPIEPVRVLLLDAENDDDELEPTMERIQALVDERAGVDAPRPALLSAPYGMDLRKRRDRSELEEVLESCRPQLIIGGPIYKLLVQQDNTSDPRHAERLQQIFDDIRKRWGCALMVEHHAPAGKPGADREIRALGGQRWAAWPEVTVALHARKNQNGPDSADVRMPHPARGRFRWPKKFERASHAHEWPWTPVWRNAADAVDPDEPIPEKDQI